MITTKGRNALKVMLDLAQHCDGNPVPLADIAERVRESQKYLESTVSQLAQHGLIISARGKSGGYRLARRPEECTVAEIITAARGRGLAGARILPDGRKAVRKRRQMPVAAAVEGARRRYNELFELKNTRRPFKVKRHKLRRWMAHMCHPTPFYVF